MPKYLWPKHKMTANYGSMGHCVQDGNLGDMRYSTMEVPSQNAYIALLTYQIVSNGCGNIIGHSIAVIHVIASKIMAQTMETPKADEMENAIQTDGRIALYGIYFDSGMADVKPDSTATLEQIAQMLKSNVELNLLVVGHTDNNGSYESNLTLSKQRADSVVAALVSEHGIGIARLKAVGVSYASPVATNASEQGKAKNRRVELVAN